MALGTGIHLGFLRCCIILIGVVGLSVGDWTTGNCRSFWVKEICVEGESTLSRWSGCVARGHFIKVVVGE